MISRKINKIYLAGFDGFPKDEPNQDSTHEMLDKLQKINKFKKLELTSLTSTKLNLKKINLNQMI